MSTSFMIESAPPAATSAAQLKTLVTIATYNELENLPSLVAQIFEFAPAVDLLVVDDNSPDGTGAWADRQAQQNPRVKVLHRTGKLGLGSAIVAGLKYGLEHGYDQVLNMDADFSHHPRYLPALLAGMGEHSVMIGSRYVPGGGVKDWPLKRQLMSRLVNLYARWMLGLKPRDCSGAYRCYSSELLRRVDFASIQSKGYSFQEEILWHLKRAGAKFGETPILFADRERGQSKINSREAWNALWIIFRFGLKNWIGI
jgi:dolichol-phosphate mannosyltransferase